MQFQDAPLKQILLDGSYVSDEDLAKADKYAVSHRGSFLDYLYTEGLITPDLVGQAIAEYLGVPYADLRAHEPTFELLSMLPEELAKKHRAVVYRLDEQTVDVATDNPEEATLKADLAAALPGLKVQVAFAVPDLIDAALARYAPRLETRFAMLMGEGRKERAAEMAPEIVGQIIEDALSLRASDIHCEPQEDAAIIRFRIDGILHEASAVPKEYFANLVNRLKVMAKLRIDDHLNPQDGAIRYASPNLPYAVDLRVSVVPTLEGEKVCMRVLSSYVRDLTLGDIGLPVALQEQIGRSTKKPFGMILVVGPTGSGKTTTLYAMLKKLNTKKVNITTIEDPVEYRLAGTNQIQVNTQTGFTFAKGLRAVVRQDPNIILVGEIRDRETADIAVNAALTGHLLLSTFHANNVATAIPRFIDMGVEPFLLGSTLELVISQRLVRRICPSCRVSRAMTREELAGFGPAVSDYFSGDQGSFYRGKGCPSCNGTGFKGRIGVYEYMSVTPELQDLIASRPSTRQVAELLAGQDFRPTLLDGLDKVRLGLTTVEEVVRVVGNR